MKDIVERLEGVPNKTAEDAIEEILKLRQELEHTQLRLKESYKQEERLEEDNRELRRTHLKRFNEEEYWIFLDDGEDYVESLICPVTMSADKLRELLSFRNEEKENLPLYLQWFNSIEDTNYSFLNDGDFRVAKTIYEKLEMRTPDSILKRLESGL